MGAFFIKVENKPRYFYGRKEKLKSRKAIQELFRSGNRFSFSSFKVIWMIDNEQKDLKAGVGASSRYFKRSVDRNRIKRLIRESYRLQKSSLDHFLAGKSFGLNLFILYSGNDVPTYEQVFQKTGMIIERLIKSIHEKTSVHT